MMRCLRPDLAFAIHRLTRKTHAPTKRDWQIGLKILRYLIYSKSLNMCIKNCSITENITIEAYSDADWAQDKEDRKSVSGTYILVNKAPIVWRTKKQTTVALSTMEAEYVAIVDTVKIMLGIYETLNELELKVEAPMMLYCDNQATISQATYEASTNRNKHKNTTQTKVGVKIQIYLLSEIKSSLVLRI